MINGNIRLWMMNNELKGWQIALFSVYHDCFNQIDSKLNRSLDNVSLYFSFHLHFHSSFSIHMDFHQLHFYQFILVTFTLHRAEAIPAQICFADLSHWADMRSDLWTGLFGGSGLDVMMDAVQICPGAYLRALVPSGFWETLPDLRSLTSQLFFLTYNTNWCSLH